ncbi:MAG: glycosyltransferase family 4 protein [Candidatus Omnitrophica bacterium]|jgi:glycosyltransferase involved in cell wall biosynthesis|nr:glycosyltransferase family 4 protein [Candidatus Omnitrophota bacterium]MDD5080127.1 glycosyltransferase family 4 protein [Candidatus Omnitrophota bacterium]
MKVIFITREGYALAGARIRCYNLSRELRSCGVSAEVLSFADTLGALDGANESRMGLPRKLKLNLRAYKLLCADKDAIFYIQRFNYHSFAPFFASLRQGNRIILDLDDWEMRDDPRYYLGFYPSSKAHYFTGLLARRSVFCVAASRFLEGFLRGFNDNVLYLPSGVDTRLFKPAGVPLEKGNEFIFSWIGTLHRKEYIENLDFAINCFRKLREGYPDIYFDILADGIYREDLLKLVRGWGDSHIRLKNWIHPDKVPGYLDTVSAGLFPAVSRNKFNLAKSPTKLFEYMAMGKPTVSSNAGEASFIVRHNENGLLAADQDGFVGAMGALVRDQPLCQRLGSSARKTVEDKYSLKSLGLKLCQSLKTL